MWEHILSLIHDVNISLEVKSISFEEIGIENEVETFIQSAERKLKSEVSRR